MQDDQSVTSSENTVDSDLSDVKSFKVVNRRRKCQSTAKYTDKSSRSSSSSSSNSCSLSDENDNDVGEEQKASEDNSEDVHVHADPRKWDKKDVDTWVKWSTKAFNIEPPLIPERFPKNGQEICDMAKADYWVCAGSKYGGNTLAKYIAYQLHSCSGIDRKDLIDDNDPGKCVHSYN